MKSDKNLWILEDDPSSRFVYEEILGLRYNLHFFETVKEFSEAFQSNDIERPDLVIADLRLPDESFLTYLSNAGPLMKLTYPFVIVSSMDDLDVLRSCYQEGAQDYLTKPFRKSELIVKIERIFSTQQAERARKKVLSNEISVDLISMKVHRDDTFVQLTQKELQIFALLYQNLEKPVKKNDIVEQVWGTVRVGNKTLDVHLFNIRTKLGELGIEIQFIPPDSYAMKGPKA